MKASFPASNVSPHIRLKFNQGGALQPWLLFGGGYAELQPCATPRGEGSTWPELAVRGPWNLACGCGSLVLVSRPSDFIGAGYGSSGSVYVQRKGDVDLLVTGLYILRPMSVAQ